MLLNDNYYFFRVSRHQQSLYKIEEEETLQVSISPMIYEQLLHQNPFAKKLQTQIVSTKKMRKELCYEKAAWKTLVKLTVIPKFFAQLLSAYNLGLQFFGKRILAQKLLIKCWWNWHQIGNSEMMPSASSSRVQGKIHWHPLQTSGCIECGQIWFGVGQFSQNTPQIKRPSLSDTIYDPRGKSPVYWTNPGWMVETGSGEEVQLYI